MLDQLNKLLTISLYIWAYMEEPFPFGWLNPLVISWDLSISKVECGTIWVTYWWGMLLFIWELYRMFYFSHLFKFLQSCTTGVWPFELWTSVCSRWTIEVWFFILSARCKALSLCFSYFLSGTLSVSLQNLRVSLKRINIHDIEYSDV